MIPNSTPKIYLRAILFYVYGILLSKPTFRILALFKGHRTAYIENVKLIGDTEFIAWSQEFSCWLRKKSPQMYDDLFLKSKFTFIQYSDVTYFNILISEFAVPTLYLKKKAEGVGAFMIWAYFYKQRCGKTIWAFIKVSRDGRKHFSLAKQETYEWLNRNDFPDSILQWFKPKNAVNTFVSKNA